MGLEYAPGAKEKKVTGSCMYDSALLLRSFLLRERSRLYYLMVFLIKGVFPGSLLHMIHTYILSISNFVYLISLSQKRRGKDFSPHLSVRFIDQLYDTCAMIFSLSL